MMNHRNSETLLAIEDQGLTLEPYPYDGYGTNGVTFIVSPDIPEWAIPELIEELNKTAMGSPIYYDNCGDNLLLTIL
ncbi:hypothetical protein [Alkalihalobacillus sp. TS-13]|uniref:hypothetical protein n=1 Tax=Alkalihalobacillus sp. TS-13 TaxID=2842455 RepID=UPI001C874C75|nr:hypothetical protein [Alkalihalobacillus sp. TS-13]